jgi:predicted lipid-binding transport protein (Tim44 family)
MAKHDELLDQGPRQAPEPETAEQRSKRLGVGGAAGGAAVGGAALAKLGFLKFFLWIFAWHGIIDAWRLGGWIALVVVLAGIALVVALRSRSES